LGWVGYRGARGIWSFWCSLGANFADGCLVARRVFGKAKVEQAPRIERDTAVTPSLWHTAPERAATDAVKGEE
jgi:hypothetical protein